MVYQVRRIERDVRVAIDENITHDTLLQEEDLDTLSISEIIRSKIEEGVRRVVTEAPVHLLDGGSTFGDSIIWTDQYSGWTLLPDDFMRLIVFKMSDWARGVYSALSAGDAKYELQGSRYKGIRGNPQKPVVAIVSRQEGRVLEFYSCNDDKATVEQGLYYPLPRVDRDGGINIPERCYRSVVYMAGGLVLSALGEHDKSELMMNLSKGLLV